MKWRNDVNIKKSFKKNGWVALLIVHNQFDVKSGC